MPIPPPQKKGVFYLNMIRVECYMQVERNEEVSSKKKTHTVVYLLDVKKFIWGG